MLWVNATLYMVLSCYTMHIYWVNRQRRRDFEKKFKKKLKKLMKTLAF